MLRAYESGANTSAWMRVSLYVSRTGCFAVHHLCCSKMRCILWQRMYMLRQYMHKSSQHNCLYMVEINASLSWHNTSGFSA